MQNKKLKILWLSHLIPYPPKGGVLIRSYNLVREMSKYHDVDILTFNQTRMLESYFDEPAEGLKICREELLKFARDLTIVEIPSEKGIYSQYRLALKSLITKTPYTINWLKSRAFQEILEEKLKNNKYDIIHFDTISLAPYLPNGSNINTVLNHHNAESQMLIRRASKEKNVLKKLYFYQEGVRLKRYEEKVVSEFAYNICCSSEDLNYLKKASPTANFEVIDNGISLNEYKNVRKYDAGTNSLLFIGGLSWYPNLSAIRGFIKDVWPKLKKYNIDLKVDIVGKNPPKDLLEIANSDPLIKIHGFVDDISEFYESAAVYICPIRDGGGTKLKVIDALANSVPLVSYKEGCEGLSIAHEVHALIATNESDFAESIVKVINDRKLGERLAKNGYDLVLNKYDFNIIGKKYSDLCQQLA